MEENCEFSIIHTECVFGNMLHKRIPARQPSLQLLCRYSQSSTEEVICAVGNRAGLSAPMSEVFCMCQEKLAQLVNGSAVKLTGE